MFRSVRLAWVWAVVASLALGACSSIAPPSAPMAEGGQVAPPIGHLSFCRRHPGECARPSAAKEETRGVVALNPTSWRELEDVNYSINAQIAPMTDVERYRRREHWAMPLTLTGGAAGDCEDYALEKRRALIDRGWPAQSLRLAVANSAWTGLHTVLVVVTDRGDFVLDNLTDQIKPWRDTRYEWRKRQSAESDYVWNAVSTQPQFASGDAWATGLAGR